MFLVHLRSSLVVRVVQGCELKVFRSLSDHGMERVPNVFTRHLGERDRKLGKIPVVGFFPPE